jgi:penicillin-binding protein 1C
LRKRIGVAAVAVIALALWLFYGPIPAVDSSRFTSTTILDRNGVPLYEPLSSSGHRGEWLPSNRIPEQVAGATVAAEDRRFYRHLGVDPLAVARAVTHDLRRHAFVEGGSTITQQVAKLMMAGDEGRRSRSIAAKIREAVVALRLERRYTKRAILAAYVNLAPYGNQIRGVARASRRYFGCAPEDLTVAQAAFLASLPQRPTTFNPLRDPTRAAARQRVILRKMSALGLISRSEYAVALRERLRFDSARQPVLAQHFIERVMEEAARGDARAPRARTIATTLDATLQRDVAGIIAARREELLRHGAHSAAVAVLDNATGEWLAWEGSGDYFGTTFGGAIDGVVALRQPGSTLKPFTYALAFERGDSPSTVIADVPSSFPTAERGIVYTPRNYDGRYRGPLRARAALAGSENVPAVALLARLGAPALLRLLRNAGFSAFTHTADYYGLGLTLGDAEVRLDQLIAAYAAFARGGLRVEPKMIRGERDEAPRRILTQRTAFWITDVLSDPAAREFIFGRGGSLDFPFAVAVKTGTSQAYRDNWTVGYTRQVTVGVWIGNFDREVLRNSSGVTGAGPIFHDVMMAAMQGRAGATDEAPIVDPPKNVQRAPVCALSGLRPSTSCPAIESDWIATDAPVRFCSWHHAGGVSWPDEYRAWAKENGMLEAHFAAGRAAEAHDRASEAGLRVVNPPDGATYMIDPTLRTRYQSLRLRAVSETGVTWRVDDRWLASVERDGSAEWPLAPGQHTVTAIDEEGRRASVRIYVK